MSDQDSTENIQEIIEKNRRNSYVPEVYGHYEIIKDLLSLRDDEIINTDYSEDKESITSLGS